MVEGESLQRDVLKLRDLFNGIRSVIESWWRGAKGQGTSNSLTPPKLMPLHPSVLPESEGLKYKNEIDTVFADPEIQNVAVSGPYGAGKSSVIAYIRRQRTKETWVTISLANFKGFNDVGVNKSGRFSNAEIETEILNQLVHRIDLNKSPKSRFRKISNKGAFSEILISVAVVLFVVLTVSLWPVGVEDLFDKNDAIGRAEAIVWITLACVGLFFMIRASLVSRFVKRLKLFNTEIELIADSDSASPFDRCQADIVYLLNSAKIDAVVFEDLDRYGAISVFTKLREINLVTNDARGSKEGTLRFFYLVKDSLFKDPKDRTKFFDFVIPVIPYVDPSNSLDILIRGFAGIGMDVDRGFLYQLSAYIDDPRLLHEIVNESAHYAESLFGLSDMGEGDSERLVAMLAYKSLFPFDYELLQVKRGYVYSVLGRKSVFAGELVRKAKGELDKLNEAVSGMGENDDKKKNVLLKQIANVEAAINRFPAMTISELIGAADDADALFSFKGEDLARPADFDELRMSAIVNSPSYPMLRFLISSGWVDDSYERYMSNFYSESMSARDASYLSSLRQAGVVEQGYVPDNPLEIVTRLDSSMVARRSARNPYLFKALLEGADTGKLHMFMKSLAQTNDVAFFLEFVVSDLFVPQVFSEALSYMESPVLDVIEGDFQDDHKRLFAKRFMLFSAENDTYRVREALNPVLEFAAADGLFLAADKKVGNRELCSALEKTGFQAASINFASCDEELVRFAYDKGLYEPNLAIVVGFMEEVHSVHGLLTRGDVLQHVFSLDGAMLKKRAEEEKSLLVSSVLDGVEGRLRDGANCVIWVINDDDIDIERRREYVKRLSGVELSDLSKVAEPALRTLLMECGLVVSSADNIVGYFKDCGMRIDNALSALVNKKSVPPTLTAEFVKQQGVDQELFLLAFLKCCEIDLSILKALVGQYGYILDALVDRELDDKRVLVLIESGSLSLNVDSLYTLRGYYDHLVVDFALSDIDGYLDLVLPDEYGNLACPFSEEEALCLLDSERLSVEEKLRLLAGFDGKVAFSSDYPDEVNIKIAQTRFNGDCEKAIEMCAKASGELRRSLISLLAQNAAMVCDEGLVLSAEILDEVIAEGVSRACSLVMITAWAKGTRPLPSRQDLCDRVEAASLNEYGTLLRGTQVMIESTPEDDALLALLESRGMCGHVSTEVNRSNKRKVYPKGGKRVIARR